MLLEVNHVSRTDDVLLLEHLQRVLNDNLAVHVVDRYGSPARRELIPRGSGSVELLDIYGCYCVTPIFEYLHFVLEFYHTIQTTAQ